MYKGKEAATVLFVHSTLLNQITFQANENEPNLYDSVFFLLSFHKMFTNECKTIHNFVTISFYNDIVVKGRPQLSFLPPILLNQNFKLTENVQRFHFGRFLFYFFISSPGAITVVDSPFKLSSDSSSDSVVCSSGEDDSIETKSSFSSLY